MFFEEHEKKIYTLPFLIGEEKELRQHDPLVVDSCLVIISDNRLNEMIVAFNAPSDGRGDISPETQRKNPILRAQAQLELAKISRKVFSLPDPPVCLDAHALEVLFDFLGWMEGKGSRGSR